MFKVPDQLITLFSYPLNKLFRVGDNYRLPPYNLKYNKEIANPYNDIANLVLDTAFNKAWAVENETLKKRFSAKLRKKFFCHLAIYL